MVRGNGLIREVVRDSLVQRLALLRVEKASHEENSMQGRSKGVVGSVYSMAKRMVGYN
jgi:hypothetical protein